MRACVMDVKMPSVHIALAQVTLGILSANMSTELSVRSHVHALILAIKLFHLYQIECV